MALQTPKNCTFDIYRGFNKSDPYTPPNRPAAYQSKQGVLRPNMRSGRFGYVLGGNVPVYWTNVLLTSPGMDLRTAYNSELNTFTEANGDTVMLYDYPTVGSCTAFVVVQLAEMARKTDAEHLAVFLDRARPRYNTACPDPTAAGSVATSCCVNNIPTRLYATISGAGGGCNGSYALNYDSASGSWLDGGDTIGSCGPPAYNGIFEFRCTSGSFFLDTFSFSYSPSSVTCAPVNIVFNGVGLSTCCGSTATVTITE